MKYAVKHVTFSLAIVSSLLLIAANCNVSTTVNNPAKNSVGTSASSDQNSSATSEDRIPESDPVAVVQELMKVAQAGETSAIKALVTSAVADTSEGVLYPTKDLLVNADVEFDPPLEFGDEFRMVKAVFTEKTDKNPRVQRFVYFLEGATGQQDAWVIFDVKKAGSASADVMRAHNDPVVGNVTQDSAAQKAMQQRVNEREYAWMTDPYLAALAESIVLGFDPHNDSYTLQDQVEQSEGSGTGIADIEVIHDVDTYILRLIQPVDQGEKGIWVINSVTKQ